MYVRPTTNKNAGRRYHPVTIDILNYKYIYI